MLLPRQIVPDLDIATLDGGNWNLAERNPDNFSVIVFYRGLHCPICARYLGDFDKRVNEFSDLGVEVIAISSDGEEQAREAQRKWKLSGLTVGYDFTIEAARKWGLYVSSGRKNEPEEFSEPGLFLVKPDQTLYASSVQTMPFARPHVDDLTKALSYVVDNDYPARGELAAE